MDEAKPDTEKECGTMVSMLIVAPQAVTQRSQNSYFQESGLKSSILGVQTATFLLNTPPRRSAAKPPTCAEGF